MLATLPGRATRLETSVGYTGKQYSERDNLALQRLDDYLTVNGKLIQPLLLGDFNAEWFINIDNLFDTNYAIHYGYPDEGFRFLTGLNFIF